MLQLFANRGHVGQLVEIAEGVEFCFLLALEDLLLPLDLDSVRLIGAVIKLLQFALYLRPLGLSVVAARLVSGIIVRKFVIIVGLVAGLFAYLISNSQFVDSQRDRFLRHFACFVKVRSVLGDQIALRCGEMLLHLLRQRKMDLRAACGSIHAPARGWWRFIRQIDGY